MKRRLGVWSLLFCAVLFFCKACDRDEGITPLMAAAKEGDTQTVVRLISEGSDPDETSAYGWTALMFAAWQGHEDVARLLVQSGADINLRSGVVPSSFSTVGNYPQTTALVEAISNRHFALTHFLLDQGAEVDPYAFAVAGGRADLDLLKQMAKSGIDINAVSENEFNRSALSSAARSGNIRNIAWLLENGADPNLALPNTSTLQEAIRGLQPNAVEMLLAAGGDPNGKIGSIESTPLWEAIYNLDVSRDTKRSIEIIEILIRHGADPGYKPKGYDRTMIERVERKLKNSEKGSRNPAHDATTQERYRQSLESYQQALDLLRSKKN